MLGGHVDRRGVVSENAAELIDDLQELVVAGEPEADESIDVAGGTIKDAVFRLRQYFGAEGAPSRVEVRVGAVCVGVVTRESLRRFSGTAGGPSLAGGGERMTLAGVSTRYRLLVFRCRNQGCPETAVRIHHDERHGPACERGHGGMVLRP
jgi:hypothetical protein